MALYLLGDVNFLQPGSEPQHLCSASWAVTKFMGKTPAQCSQRRVSNTYAISDTQNSGPFTTE